jgi:H+-translocating NAD(P) transhydrogenase subunit alpha
VEVEGATEDKAAGGYAVEQTEEFKKNSSRPLTIRLQNQMLLFVPLRYREKRHHLLIPKEAVEAMKPGSVIIDLAASSGGNCELTKNNETVVHKGVTIIGQSNYPAQKPLDASRMFGKNVLNFMKLIIGKEGELNLNFEDDIVKGTCITIKGEIYNERVKSVIENK